MQPLARGPFGRGAAEPDRSLGTLSSATFAALAESQVEPVGVVGCALLLAGGGQGAREREEGDVVQRGADHGVCAWQGGQGGREAQCMPIGLMCLTLRSCV